MDAACTIQDSIHVFSLVRKYVSRILGTYHRRIHPIGAFCLCGKLAKRVSHSLLLILFQWSIDCMLYRLVSCCTGTT